MTRFTFTCGLVALLAIAVTRTAPAHHSFAMFDTANPITVSGVVTAFEWTNPHAYIELDVTDAGSKERGQGVPANSVIKHWTIELGSTSILMRAGWRFSTIKKGDKVTAVVAPLRSGEPGCLLVRVTLADGRVLGNGGAGGIGGGTTEPATPTPR